MTNTIDLTHHTVTANGIRQHYVEAGEGAPVVLPHGFPETHYAWRHQIPVLAQHYRVIAPDLRGYAAMEKRKSQRAATTSGQCQTIYVRSCANCRSTVLR